MRFQQPGVDGQLYLFGVTEGGRNMLAGWGSWGRAGRGNALGGAVRLAAGEPLVRHKRDSDFGWSFVCPVPECGVMQCGYDTKRECHNAWFDHCREAAAHAPGFTPRWPHGEFPLEEPVHKRLSKLAWEILETGTADTPRDVVAWAVGAATACHGAYFMGEDCATVRFWEEQYRGGSMDRGWYQSTRSHFLVESGDRKANYLRVPWRDAARLVRPQLVTASMRGEMKAAMRHRRDMTGYDANGRARADQKTWWAIEERAGEAAARIWEACMPASVRRMAVRAICEA